MKTIKTSVLLFFLIIGISALSLDTTWTSIYGPLFRHLNSVVVKNFNNICMVGGNKTNDSIQTILTSQNAGQDWDLLTDLISPWLKSVYFTDANNGIAVGEYGKILKTTDGGNSVGSWQTITLTGNASQRHYNSVFFSDNQNGFAVGGNPNNDSIATILKTTNGGDDWQIQKDTLGYWLNSVYFINLDTGFAVGDKGTIYKTTNSGTIWTQISVSGNPGTRDYNSVYFTSSDTGIIVGGNLTNDSIQTILKTTDCGETWNVIRDNIAPCLNSVYFYDGQNGYAVGNSETVLKTTNSGDTWQDVDIPENGQEDDFYSVQFLNSEYGYIVGKWGVIYRYYSGAQGPTVTTTPATEVTQNSAKLNGIVNSNGFLTTIFFEYGTTTDYGTVVDATPSSTTDTNDINAYGLISGLLPDTFYHFCIKATNIMGTSYGNDMMFYTGSPIIIPNFDFEIWDTTLVNLPDFWNISGAKITQYSPACHNNYAVKLQNDSVNPDEPGAILIGYTDAGQSFTGGAPFNARPDTLIGCFNYDILGNDTALIMLFFKKQGTFISNNLFKIFGSSSGNFVDLKFPIQYSSGEIPDSLIIGITCTDYRNHQQLPIGGYLIADYLQFTGTSQNIPNYDFEQWTPTEYFSLTNWDYYHKLFFSNSNITVNDNKSVYRTNDAKSGQYAALIQNHISPSDTMPGWMRSGDQHCFLFKVNNRHTSLTGYYKYYPENNDSLNIMINMYKNSQNIGYGQFQTGALTDIYTPFIIDIDYWNDTIVPDSAEIQIQAYSSNKPKGNSILYIDCLKFDELFDRIKEPYVTDNSSDLDINIYPNPFYEQTTILFSVQEKERVVIRIFDISGNEIAQLTDKQYNAGRHKLIFSSEGLSKGLYICVINTKKSVFYRKLILY